MIDTLQISIDFLPQRGNLRVIGLSFNGNSDRFR